MPLIYIADLYHPPQDPDDHIDLATLCALPEFDLRCVLLDCSRKFLVPSPEGWDVARDPGFVPVAQLAYLLGRTIPAAVGPSEPLRSSTDTAEDRPATEQAAVRLLLETLAASPVPVTFALTGSARILTAAFNRAPALVRAKTRRVLLNAGATGGPKREWNVMLDTAAYVGLWRSGLPIDWYPCATETGAFNPSHERGTHWRSTHAELFRGVAAPVSAWFAYALGGSGRGDIIQALSGGPAGDGVWSHALVGPRNLWSTISLVQAAGRQLARTTEGWRFVPATTSQGLEVWPMRLDPITASTDEMGTMTWQLASDGPSPRLFGREAKGDFGAAMTGALNGLLRELHA
ncbi:MAG: hypothetical protein JSR48_05065 [Verrucomicrobia bacterium]|nr:hypothetical protein [Verrucomicrobiota bacterium]